MKKRRTIWLSLLVSFVLALTMAFAFVGCGGDEPPAGPENPSVVDPGTQKVAKVTLDKTAITLDIGGEMQLNATKENTDAAIVWTSSAPAVATVTNGLVKGVSAGSATITATAGTASATCQITVKAATSTDTPTVTLDKTAITLDIDGEMQLNATKENTDAAIVWTSSAPAVATVTNGLVKGVSAGSATITATAGTASATCQVTVKAGTGPVDPGTDTPTVTLDRENLSIEFMEEKQLTATKVNTDETIVWTSSAPTIVTVTQDGTVKGVAVGSADITATAGTASATCHVTVSASTTAPVVTLESVSDTIDLSYGDTFTVNASVTWKGAALPADIAVSWSWTAEDDDIITLTSNGAAATITALQKVGETTLTATATVTGVAQPAAASVTVSVKKPTVTYQFEGGGAFEAQSGKYVATLYTTATGDHATTLDVLDNLTFSTRGSNGTLTPIEDPTLTYEYDDANAFITIEDNVITAKAHTENETDSMVAVTVTCEETEVTFYIKVLRPDLGKLEQTQNFVLESEKLPTTPVAAKDITTTTLEGTLDCIKYQGVVITESGNGGLTFKSNLPKTTAVLGEGKTFELYTDKAKYTFTVDYYTCIIKTPEDLTNMMKYAYGAEESDLLWGGYFILGNDIDYGTYTPDPDKVSNGPYTEADNPSTTDKSIVDVVRQAGWYPLLMGYGTITKLGGAFGGTNGGFCGTFDGRGYAIENITVARYGASIFGISTADALVKNTAFIDVTIGDQWDPASLIYVTGRGKIEDVYVRVKAQSKGQTNDNKTGVSFGSGIHEGAKMTRVFIDTYVPDDLADAYGVGKIDLEATPNVFDGVYVVGCTPTKAVANGKSDKFGAYASWTELAEAHIDFTSWAGDFWKIVNGYPYPTKLTPSDTTTAPDTSATVESPFVIEVTVNRYDVITVTAAKNGADFTDFTVAWEEIDRNTRKMTITPGSTAGAGVVFTVTAQNCYSASDVKTAKITLIESVSVDASSVNLGDVAFAEDDFKTLNVATQLAGTEGLDGVDLNNMKLISVTFNGHELDGVSYADGVLTFTTESFAPFRTERAYGEREFTMVATSDGSTYTITMKATFVSVVITKAEQMERTKFESYGDDLTVEQITQYEWNDTWAFKDGYTVMKTGYWVLGADVDVSGITAGFHPGYINNPGVMGSAIVNSVFDGRGHVIKNYKTMGADGAGGHYGFFNYAYGVTVKNLTFIDAELTGPGGLLINRATGCTVENVAVYGRVSGTDGNWYDASGGAGGLVIGIAANWHNNVEYPTKIKNVLAVITGIGNWTGTTGGIVLGYGAAETQIENVIAINLVESSDLQVWGLPGVNLRSGAGTYNRTDKSQFNGGYEKVETFHGWQEYVTWAKGDGKDVATWFASDFWAKDAQYDGVFIPVPAGAKENTALTSVSAAAEDSTVTVAAGATAVVDINGYYVIVTEATEGLTPAADGYLAYTGTGEENTVTVKSMLGEGQVTVTVKFTAEG